MGLSEANIKQKISLKLILEWMLLTQAKSIIWL